MSAGGVVCGVRGPVVLAVVVPGGVLVVLLFVVVVRGEEFVPPGVVGAARRGAIGTTAFAPVLVAPGVPAPVVVPTGLLPAVFDALVGETIGLEQLGLLIVLSSRVTAPVRASKRPEMDAPVLAVTEASAMMLPTKRELVPSVAELPTCQKTLHAVAPPVSATTLELEVMSVLPAWNTNTAEGSFWASRVTVPESAKVGAAYTPGVSVCPVRSGVTEVTGSRPAASLYAVVTSS